MPPSTLNVPPVIQLACGEARKTTSPATSAGSPMRPAGTGRRRSVSASTASTVLAVDDAARAGRGGDVGGDRPDPPAAGADLTGDRLGRLAAARVDHQLRARPGQLEGDCAPDPPARACDQGDLAGELHHTTPSARSCSISVAESPIVRARTSAVCSPGAGAGAAAKRSPATLTGVPKSRRWPATGWSCS